MGILLPMAIIIMRTINILFTVFLLILLFCKVSSQWISEFNPSGNPNYEYIDLIDSSTYWGYGNYGFSKDTSFVFKYCTSYNYEEILLPFMVDNKVSCVAGIDSIEAFIGTYNGKIYHTTDNGYSWENIISLGENAFVNDIKVCPTNKKFIYVYADPPEGIGHPFKILKSSNSGLNWITYSPILGNNYVGVHKSISITDSDHVWLGLYCYVLNCTTPMIAFTTNGGIDWQTKIVDGNYSPIIYSIAFKNNSYGIAAPWSEAPVNFYKSTNGGISWFLFNTTIHQEPITSIIPIEDCNMWYYSSGDDGIMIYKSTNDGNYWTKMEVPTFWDPQQVSNMDIIRKGNRIYGRAVTYQGRILKMVDSTSLIGVQQNINSQPSEFLLYQNYPNPFNPTTNIRFDIPVSGIVKLVVYDITGKIVSELANGNYNSGKHSIQFNAEKLSSGVYFYKIEVRQTGSSTASYIETKKMLLIK